MDVNFERERLGKLLLALGDTTDKVAATIRAQGIVGQSGSTHECPVARYLVAQTGLRVRVLAGNVVLYPAEVDEFGLGFVITKVSLPRSVGTFVMMIDSGRYPDLVVPEPKAPDPDEMVGTRSPF